MPRYVIERRFPDCLRIPLSEEGARACLKVVDTNADHGVTWIQSYVTLDRKKSYCIYDAPNPEAVRTAARRAELPVDRITEVRVLDPYFYL